MNIKTWIIASRPKTLPASIAPVLLASSIAFTHNSKEYATFIIILLCAILIQVSTNLINDYVDYKKGTDIDRVGPTRVTQSGMAKPEQVKSAIYIVNILAIILGFVLVLKGGLPILLIGLSALLCALWYSAGPLALSYFGIAEIFVFIFFGPVATVGTYYLLTNSYNTELVILGIPLGLISTAVLVANNSRDYNSDKAANKKTLVVRFGQNFGKFEYATLLILAIVIPIILRHAYHIESIVAGLVILPLCIKNIKAFFNANTAQEFLPMLPKTAKLLILYSLSFIITLLF